MTVKIFLEPPTIDSLPLLLAKLKNKMIYVRYFVLCEQDFFSPRKVTIADSKYDGNLTEVRD